MEGKTITKVLELESGYQALLLDGEEVAIVKVVTPDLSIKELQDFLGATKEDAPDETPKENESDPDEDEYTWDDILKMNRKDLIKFIKENDLDTDPDDFEKDELDEFRKEVAEEIDIEVPEDEEETEEEPDKDDKYTYKDLQELDYDELEELVEEQKLEVDPDDFEEEEEEKFRRAIAKELKIDVPKKKKK